MSEVNPVGRPPKYTPERLKAILHSISNRIPYEIAAEANGICEDTLYDWINKGKADRKAGIDSIFSKFSEDIKKIEQDRIGFHLEKLANNVERWQADAWILERRWYKHFGANVHLHELENRMKQVEQKKELDNGQES